MDIEETTKEFISIWRTVYADDTLDQATRPVKLEEAIKSLLNRKKIPEIRRMYVENTDDPPCKVYVLRQCAGYRLTYSQVCLCSPRVESRHLREVSQLQIQGSLYQSHHCRSYTSHMRYSQTLLPSQHRLHRLPSFLCYWRI